MIKLYHEWKIDTCQMRESLEIRYPLLHHAQQAVRRTDENTAAIDEIHLRNEHSCMDLIQPHRHVYSHDLQNSASLQIKFIILC